MEPLYSCLLRNGKWHLNGRRSEQAGTPNVLPIENGYPPHETLKEIKIVITTAVRGNELGVLRAITCVNLV